MKNQIELRPKRRLSALFVSSALVSMSAYAADIPDSGNLTLQEAVRIAIKNAPSMIVAAIQVDLAKADERTAAGPFDPTFKASMALDNVRGYRFPNEFQQFPAAMAQASAANAALLNNPLAAPAVPASPVLSTFMTDHQNNSEFKTGLSKLFRNGVFADFSIALQSSDSDKVRSDLAPIPPVLSNGIPPFMSPLKPGAVLGDYAVVHPSSVTLTINVPLLKFSGENNIAAAAETQKRYEREAAELTLKHGVATIIQNVVNSYWDYKGALTKLKYTQDSETQVRRWLGGLERSMATGKGDKPANLDTARQVAHLQGFATQLSADVSKAREAVNVARNALAQALGIASEESRKLVQANDDYPLDWSAVLASFNDDLVRKKWNDLAEQNRFDLKAARLQFDAANAIHLGAQNDAQSKLDLSLVLKQQGLSSGGGNRVDLASLTTGTSQLGQTVFLSFEKKIFNDVAEALVTKTRYLRLQKEVEFNNTKRGVGLSVDTAVSSVRNSLVGLAAAKRQSEYYVTALAAMVKNDTIELGKVFDLVVIEQARLKAFTDNVTAIQNVANAVTAAHFQTGRLLKQVTDNIQEVVINDLTRLP